MSDEMELGPTAEEGQLEFEATADVALQDDDNDTVEVITVLKACAYDPLTRL